MTGSEKTYKVRNGDGMYLSFDLEASTGKMRPIWGGIAMSYPFEMEEARRLANVFQADLVAEDEFRDELKAALDKMFPKRR